METSRFTLHCSLCRRRYSLESSCWRCPSCKKPLEVHVEYPKTQDFSSLINHRELSLWRYRRLIPFSERAATLGEGLTPLIRHSEEGVELYFKLEYVTPTGSFKDRGATVGVARVKAIGVKGIVEDSSGNAGLSYSIYSAYSGVKARVYVPHDAPLAKRELMRKCGSEVIECKTREEASQRAVSEFSEDYLYVGHTWDPFFLEGVKTEVYELYEFADLNFDSIIVPVSSGTHILGLYKGFKDLISMGFIDHLPRLFAVQAGGCTPIYDKFYGVRWEGEPGLLADGLRVREPPRMGMIIEAIKESDGVVLVVGDKEIVEAMKHLYRIGLVVEPTSAAVYAAYKKCRVEAGMKVFIPLTGTGMKTLDKLQYIG